MHELHDVAGHPSWRRMLAFGDGETSLLTAKSTALTVLNAIGLNLDLSEEVVRLFTLYHNLNTRGR